jgi:hypothetical protein
MTTPGNPDDRLLFGKALSSGDRGPTEIVVRATGLPALVENFSEANVNKVFAEKVDIVYTELGRKLVDEVKKRTPVASGRLRRSTKFRIVRGQGIVRQSGGLSSPGDLAFSVAQPQDAQLQIIQDARDLRMGQKYFYWYTVTHGIEPRGKLRGGKLPPWENLLPWVKIRFSTDRTGSIIASKRLSHHISKEGIEPNTYIADSYHARIGDIQLAAEKLGIDITFDLTRLPDI